MSFSRKSASIAGQRWSHEKAALSRWEPLSLKEEDRLHLEVAVATTSHPGRNLRDLQRQPLDGGLTHAGTWFNDVQ